MLKEKEKYDHESFINHVDMNHTKALQNRYDTVNKHL